MAGVRLCGSNSNDYTVTLQLWDRSTGLVVELIPEVKGTFSSRLLEYKGSTYYGFKVLFDSSVALKKNIFYIISASITGPPSWKGVGGIARVQSSGVTFQFHQGCFSIPPGILRSNQLVGQFPEFLFSVYPEIWFSIIRQSLNSIFLPLSLEGDPFPLDKNRKCKW